LITDLAPRDYVVQTPCNKATTGNLEVYLFGLNVMTRTAV
jgi:hypothetical protein